jgi:hypothetical protein
LTWERYVDPRMAPSLDYLDTWRTRPMNNKHFGQVCILGITDKLSGSNMGWVSIKDIQGRSLQATAPTSQLQLGYKDDKYTDNGYTGKNDGPGMQCKGVEDAWVKVEIRHPSAGAGSQAISAEAAATSTANTGSTGTTAPASDTTMPQLLSLTTNPAGFNYQGGGIAVYVTAADNVAVQGVTMTLFKPDGSKSGHQDAEDGRDSAEQPVDHVMDSTHEHGKPAAHLRDQGRCGRFLEQYTLRPEAVTFTVAAKPTTGSLGQPSGTPQPATTLPQNPQTPVNSIQNKLPVPLAPVTQPNSLQNTAPIMK